MGLNEKSNYSKFRGIYNEKVAPVFLNAEIARKKLLKEYRIKTFLFFILPAIILAGITAYGFIERANNYRNNDSLIAMVAPILLFFAIPVLLLLLQMFKNKYNGNFTRELKAAAFDKLLSVFGVTTRRTHDALKPNTNAELLEDSEIRRSDLFINYNTRYTEDEFEGVYEGVKYKISETKMYDIHSSGKHRTCIEAFRGVIVTFKYNKRIKNRTIVSTKGDMTKKNQELMVVLCVVIGTLQIFSNGFAIWKLILYLIAVVSAFAIYWGRSGEALDRVVLEDPKFNKRFDVYSSDQVEARFLVTPSFMHRFSNLQTAFGAKKAKCSFFGDTLMIAIHTKKNLFEVGSLFKDLNDPSTITEFYREINSIFKMIDYFKLNQKIYTQKG